MTSHPADVVFVDGSNVSKAAVRSYDKLRTRIRVADVLEVRSTDLSGQYGGIYVASIEAEFNLDASDATSPDDGATCIRDSAGNGFFIVARAGSFSGAYDDLTGKPTLFSGAYADLTGKPTLFSGAYADLTGKPTLRGTLSASRTYYVRTDGSDSNDGLANTAGGAFLTIQKAIDTISTLDILTYNVTIQVADGTYTGVIVCNGPWLGSGLVTLQGNTSTPSNCLLSTTAQLLTVKNGASLIIAGFKLTATAGHLMEAVSGGYIEYSYMNFGSASTASHVRCSEGGKIKATSAYTISGGAVQHWSSVGAGSEIRCQFQTITITGTPAFSSQFANAQLSGGLLVNGNTFSGSATGSRYNAADLGRIYTAGAGTTYFPGNAAGTGTNPSASPYGLYN